MKTAEYELIRRFSEDCCNFSDSEEITETSNLYDAFCEVFGNVFKDVTAFSEAFNEYNADRVKIAIHHTSNGHYWAYRGVSLKEE